MAFLCVSNAWFITEAETLTKLRVRALVVLRRGQQRSVSTNSGPSFKYDLLNTPPATRSPCPSSLLCCQTYGRHEKLHQCFWPQFIQPCQGMSQVIFLLILNIINSSITSILRKHGQNSDTLTYFWPFSHLSVLKLTHCRHSTKILLPMLCLNHFNLASDYITAPK